MKVIVAIVFITGISIGLVLGIHQQKKTMLADVVRLYCERIEDRAAFEMCRQAIVETFSGRVGK